MFEVIGWLIYGVVVGSIARAIHSGGTPPGWVPTIAVGICGSVLGGIIHSMISGGRENSAGIVFGVVGGVLACALWGQIQKNQ